MECDYGDFLRTRLTMLTKMVMISLASACTYRLRDRSRSSPGVVSSHNIDSSAS
jgi:hypothetical protein